MSAVDLPRKGPRVEVWQDPRRQVLHVNAQLSALDIIAMRGRIADGVVELVAERLAAEIIQNFGDDIIEALGPDIIRQAVREKVREQLPFRPLRELLKMNQHRP